MSMTDYRKLIDIHGGKYIGVECTDGTTIEIGINGEAPAHVHAEHVTENIIPRLQGRMHSTLHDGFKTFTFGFGGTTVDLNYYDAGLVLDTLRECVRYLA